MNGPLTQSLLSRDDQSQYVQPAQKPSIHPLAKSIYAAGAGADAASTLYGQHTGLVHEANPLISWAGKAAVPVGAGMELGTILLMKKLLGENHPKIMNAALMGLGGLHGALAARNMGTINSAKKGSQ